MSAMGVHNNRRRPISVLIVEDNPDHRFLIERRLADEGIAVRVVGTGEEAVDSLDGVDIVLLDYRLEGSMDGLETLAAIRDRRGPSVVMVTGMGSEDLAVQAMRAGALDYIVKDQSYLGMLPEMVERAWRHHDLARRANQLQRLALMVSTAEDRDTIFNEVVTGAQELLDAATCALFIVRDGALHIAAITGETAEPLEAMLGDATTALARGVEDPLSADGRLYVCLHEAGEDPVGILVTEHDATRPLSPADVELAQAFASFAGVAVKNFMRLELERELIRQLQQTVETRRDFVSSISHELRTPLACISGFSKTLQDRWEELDEPTIRDCLDRIYKHSMDLADLVQQVLDFRTFESARFSVDVRPVDLETELDGVIAGLQPIIGDRTMRKEIPHLKVLADSDLLKRTFMNLLENALKYSEPDQEVVIRAVEAGALARIEVIDKGVGLSLEEQAEAFTPFWRARSAIVAAARGVGIGLTLVGEYSRMMGGEAGVESIPGVGSTFYFTLPLAQNGLGA